MATKQTSSDAYTAKHAEAVELVQLLAKSLQDMPAPDSGEINWNHVGSITEAVAALKEAAHYAGSLAK